MNHGQRVQEGRKALLALSVAKNILLHREVYSSEYEYQKAAQVAKNCFAILKQCGQNCSLENSEADLDSIVSKIKKDSQGYKDLLKTLTKFQNITDRHQMDEAIIKESVKFFSDARIQSAGLDERKRLLVREMCLAVWVLLREILKSNSAMISAFPKFQGLNWINWFSQEYSEKSNQYLRSILADIRGMMQNDMEENKGLTRRVKIL